MKLFDLHCDTLTEIYASGESLLKNSCNISLDIIGNFDKYVQVLAVWSNPNLNSDQLYDNFFATISHFKSSSFPLSYIFWQTLIIRSA